MTSPSDHPRIHQLPEFEECGYSPSFEYGLPVTGVLPEHRDVLSQWIRRVADLDGEQAHAALRERWSGELDGPLEPLLQYLLQFRPASVVVQDQRSWLMAVRAETESTHSTFFLIPDPVERAELESRLNACGMQLELLTRILLTLAGLREDFAPSGGAFIYPRCR